MAQLMRYQPLLTELEREADALLQGVFGPLAVPRWYPARTTTDARWAPACDVFSRDGDLVVRLDLPGIDPAADVKVTVEDGLLCVRGERRLGELKDGSYYRREWQYGSFERGIPLPDGVTGEGITAGYADGVLEVVLPKAAPRTEPRRIPVSIAGAPQTLPAGQPRKETRDEAEHA